MALTAMTLPVLRGTVLRQMILVCGVLVASIGSAAAQNKPAGGTQPDKGEWPQFLGPHRNGISLETGLLDSWPAAGLKKVWQAPGGVGMSGLVISRDRLVTMIQKDGQQWLVALNSRTGEPVWQTALAPEYRNQMGNGPRATPVISGDRVLAFRGEGILAAVSLRPGRWPARVRECQPSAAHRSRSARR